MKHIIYLFIFISLAACSHAPMKNNFDKTKKVQVIQIEKKQYVYAQNDILLNSTLEKELSQMSPQWDKEIQKYNSYMTTSRVGFTLQVLAFIGCLVASDPDATTAWCSTTVASGFLVGFPYFNKANRQKHKVITDYNSKFKN